MAWEIKRPLQCVEVMIGPQRSLGLLFMLMTNAAKAKRHQAPGGRLSVNCQADSPSPGTMI
jgi:hypothetical protein